MKEKALELFILFNEYTQKVMECNDLLIKIQKILNESEEED